MSNESPLRIENTLLLENLGDNGDGGIYWVGDDKDESLGCALGDADGKVTYDTCVDLAED